MSETFSGQLRPITRQRDKRETGYVFKCNLSDGKSWIYLPWRGTSFRFLLQVRTWSGLTAGPAKPSPVALIIRHDPVLNVSNTEFLPLFYIYKIARYCQFNTAHLSLKWLWNFRHWSFSPTRVELGLMPLLWNHSDFNILKKRHN